VRKRAPVAGHVLTRVAPRPLYRARTPNRKHIAEVDSGTASESDELE